MEVKATLQAFSVRMPGLPSPPGVTPPVYLAHLVPRLCPAIDSLPLLLASLHVLRSIVTSPIESPTLYEVAPLGDAEIASVQRESPLVAVTVTVQPASTLRVQPVKVTLAPVTVMLLAPVLTTSLPPAASVEIVESLQGRFIRPPTAVNLVPVVPDPVGLPTVAVSVITQVALPPVHVILAEAVGANAQAAMTATRARSPSFGMSLMFEVAFLYRG